MATSDDFARGRQMARVITGLDYLRPLGNLAISGLR